MKPPIKLPKPPKPVNLKKYKSPKPIKRIAGRTRKSGSGILGVMDNYASALASDTGKSHIGRLTRYYIYKAGMIVGLFLIIGLLLLVANITGGTSNNSQTPSVNKMN